MASGIPSYRAGPVERGLLTGPGNLNMNTRHCSLWFALLIATAAMPAFAQDTTELREGTEQTERGSWSVGVTSALTVNNHTGGNVFRYSNYPEVTTRRETQKGSGTSYQAGLAIALAVNSTVSIEGRAIYDRRPGRYEAIRVCDCDSQVIEYTDVTEIDLDLITTDLSLSARLVELAPRFSVSLSAGFSVGYVADSRTYTYGGPIIHGPNTREEDPIRFANKWRLSGRGGIATTAHIGDRLGLRSGVFFDYGLTDVTTNDSWRVNSIIIQLDVMVTL